MVTYNALLTNNYGTKDLFSALEGYRKAFAPTQTNNEWFKSQTKALIVEEKSNIPEVRANQEKLAASILLVFMIESLATVGNTVTWYCLY